MRRLATFLFAAIVVIMYSGCEPAGNTTAPNAASTNANAAKPAGPAPTADALMALENKAWEAWKNKDTKFFEEFTADPFVGFDNTGTRSGRAEAIKMIAENKCEVKSTALSDPKLTPAGADVAVLTYKATQDATCEGAKLPETVTAATVFVRSGDKWKAAYHNEVAVVTDSKTMKPPAPPKKDEANVAANSNTAANTNTASSSPASDALTTELLAVEKSGWEAWKAKDQKKLEDTTHKDLMFVDPMGKATSGQAAVIKMWMDEPCEVKSVNVTDAKATSLNPTTAILTYKGHADGTCGGQPLMTVWATTVAVKEGDKWRAVLIFETPMM